MIDFSGLPESVELVYDSDEFFQRAHNIFIDEDNARLYTSGGIRVFDLSNPEQPVLLDHLRTRNLPIPFYAHDIFIRDHILYINGAFDGLAVVDYTDTNDPQVLGTLENYPNQGYNHAGWLSDDGNHYYLCDETGGADVKTVRVDDFADMEVIDRYKADNNNPEHIAHNPMVRGDRLYVSYYTDGVQVFDISDPANVKRTWNFDTFCGTDGSGFSGAWGIHALLPSGRVLLSDLQTGFYYFEPPVDLSFFSFKETFDVCTDDDLTFTVFVGNGFEESGVELEVTGIPTGATVSYSENPAPSNSNVDVTISNWSTAGDYEVMISGNDANNSVQTLVDVEVGISPSGPTNLVFPEEGAIDVSVIPTFEWEMDPNQNTYLIEISLTPSFNLGNITDTVVGNTYAIETSAPLIANFNHYWRVTTLAGSCGMITSEVKTFRTGALNTSTENLTDSKWSVFPNPVDDFMIVQTSERSSEQLEIQLLDITGKLISTWYKTNEQEDIVLDVNKDWNGIYVLKISNGDWTQIERVVIE